ncbi:MAG: hypothetical protein AABX47_02985 [Nanoarchaeota archaeon]
MTRQNEYHKVYSPLLDEYFGASPEIKTGIHCLIDGTELVSSHVGIDLQDYLCHGCGCVYDHRDNGYESLKKQATAHAADLEKRLKDQKEPRENLALLVDAARKNGLI